MSFFFGNLKLENVMVAGVRSDVTKAGKPFSTLTVVDDEGNVNQLSTTEPQTMQELKALQTGDRVNLRIVCAGGPKKQYAMLARGAGSVEPADALPSNVGY